MSAAPRPVIALVGRPNVGKSTLFNRIAGRKAAIVEDRPGVTRDRNYADATWDNRAFSIVDTGGFEPASRDALLTQVRDQARLAVEEAAAVVLVVDGREGLTSVDEAVANLLRRGGKPYFVAANKMDTPRTEEASPLAEFHRLGLGDVFGLSAEHGRGVDDLLDAIVEKLALPRLPAPPEEDEEAEEPEEVTEDQRPKGDIRVAIVGRPNVGKSTFVNALLGQERFVVSEIAGTTRDAIDTRLEHKGQAFVVTDTAGIRKKRADLPVEAASIIRAMKAMDRAEVVACLLDATEAGVEQDARLLGMVVEKAKVLLIVVNKWDIAEREGATKDWYRKELLKRFPFAAFAPMLFVSAKKGQGIAKVLEEAARLTEQYRARFPTRAMNELLEQLQDEHPAPIVRGKRVKLFYAAQVAYSPPTFSIQCSRPESLPDDYCRYVENRFRDAFGLEVPMLLVFKERRRERRRNPHRDRKEPHRDRKE